MRELKFRAWDRLTSKMSPSFSLFGEFTLIGGVHAWQHECAVKLSLDLLSEKFDSLGRLNDLEVMQSTGLKDRNGTPIFEGDLIRVDMCECVGHDDEGNEIWEDCEGPVSFEDGMFVFDGHSAGTIPLNAYIENVTVIGNIHLTP